DVRRAAATLVAGEEVGDVFRDGRAYDVQVWSTPATRSSVTSIEDLPIDTPSGARVRLADVADVSLQATPNQIDRTNGSRRVAVGCFPAQGEDLGGGVSAHTLRSGSAARRGVCCPGPGRGPGEGGQRTAVTPGQPGSPDRLQRAAARRI